MTVIGLLLKPWTGFVGYKEYSGRRGDIEHDDGKKV